ncbi:MAG: lipid-A-disaccharide synthase [Bacteroidales bacterium]|jgi:lipid-A-disaccharide synthase
MKYYIIAGEASGDLHASNLMKQLKLLDNKADFRCWGGDLMKEQGAVLVKHYRDLAFMGFTEILFNIKTILRNFKFCKSDILQYKPDALILVDYPGFNMKIAGFAKETGIKVFYYISPQVWAWKQGRVKKIKKTVDKMFVILPFEKEFYKRFDFEVDFVGHPLIDAINDPLYKSNIASFRNTESISDKPVIAILPGSRKQEIAKMLPIMLTVIKKFPEFEFVVAAVTSLPKEFYENICEGYNVKIVYGKTYLLLSNAKASIVTSGTATLETALFSVPEVVCYKGSSLSFMLAKKLVKVNFISLVNLIMEKEVVKELIQKDFNSNNLSSELSRILIEDNSVGMKQQFSELKKKLGGAGASAKTAELIIENLRK